MKRVLYVEDNKDIATAVKLLLEHAGFETAIAFTGREGIRKAKGRCFDLVLIDITLEDLSGWEVFESMKHSNAGPSKFAFLSVVPISREHLSEMRKAGVSDYIEKPFEKDDLVARVRRLLE